MTSASDSPSAVAKLEAAVVPFIVSTVMVKMEGRREQEQIRIESGALFSWLAREAVETLKGQFGLGEILRSIGLLKE